jgi:hypothetical protein
MAKWFKQQERQQEFKDNPPPLALLLAVLAAREILPHHKRDQLQFLIEDRQWDQFLNNELNNLAESSNALSNAGGNEQEGDHITFKIEDAQGQLFPGCQPRDGFCAAQPYAAPNPAEVLTQTVRQSIEHQDWFQQNAHGKRAIQAPCDGHRDEEIIKRARLDYCNSDAQAMSRSPMGLSTVDHVKILTTFENVITQAMSKQTKELHDAMPTMVKDALRQGPVKELIQQAISEGFKTLKEINDSQIVQRSAAADNPPARMPHRYAPERGSEGYPSPYGPYLNPDPGVYEEIRRFPARTAGGVFEGMWH